MIKATGRYFCDFLQSVDNIHLQMRFTYRKMKSPSMQISEVDMNGAVLIYRSTRAGFSKYVMGELETFQILLNPDNSSPARTTPRDCNRDLRVGLESQNYRFRKRQRWRNRRSYRHGRWFEERSCEVSIRFWQLWIRNDTETHSRRHEY